MTPTLMGRWQSRIFILGTVGLIITLLFGAAVGNLITPLVILASVIVLGLFWDMIYIYLQSFRWDQDWPPLFVLFTGIWEAVAVAVFIHMLPEGFIPGFALPFAHEFFIHYTLVWIASYIMLFSVMRILFPRWRFRGGRVI